MRCGEVHVRDADLGHFAAEDPKHFVAEDLGHFVAADLGHVVAEDLGHVAVAEESVLRRRFDANSSLLDADSKFDVDLDDSDGECWHCCCY